MDALSEVADCLAEPDNRSDRSPRIALLSPYSGGNFGDAAIQDSMIANLRTRLPNAQFSGISLSNQNYLRRHGSDAYALCALNGSFWGMTDSTENRSGSRASSIPRHRSLATRLRASLHRVPGLTRAVRALKYRLALLKTELRHWRGGYDFLQGQSMLIVCGGGQLDEEWGGPWGHPYALFKWTMLAKFAGIPCAMVSVGAGKLQSRLSRFFLKQAIRFSSYRSYRDKNSKKIASSLSRKVAIDPVVPDLAFCLPESEIPDAIDLSSLAGERRIVTISPIVYGKPGVWPTTDASVFCRYMDEMSKLVSELLDLDYFVVFVWSGSNDRGLITEILAGVATEHKAKVNTQTHVAQLDQWKDLVAVLKSSEALVASRLHSVLLGLLVRMPVVAISFDKKVDWAMRDLDQLDALLQIRSFTAAEVVATLRSVEGRRESIVESLSLHRRQALLASIDQIDRLTQLAAKRVEKEASGTDVL